jgi:hypothetical protein
MSTLLPTALAKEKSSNYVRCCFLREMAFVFRRACSFPSHDDMCIAFADRGVLYSSHSSITQAISYTLSEALIFYTSYASVSPESLYSAFCGKVASLSYP